MVLSCFMGSTFTQAQPPVDLHELLGKMTLEEKVGQLTQVNAHDSLPVWIQKGQVGSILNEVNPATIAAYQRIAREDSRLGIPLLVARDVIHGFRTIFPVPLGQAATWNPELVEEAASLAALEAASQGINWTFSPMLDVTRDPRWGRVVESFGEDAHLNSILGAAMVRGYQGDDLSSPENIAACAKHYLAYGWAEGGRDYNTANVGEPTIHEHILPPFRAAIAAGAATVMTAFQDINGIPATGHAFWVGDYLRKSLAFDGLVVSDWVSIGQLVTHGYAKDEREATQQAIAATVDMDMQSRLYLEQLPELVKKKVIPMTAIDSAVMRVLRLKQQLGLFSEPTVDYDYPDLLDEKHLETARQMAAESIVLLKNDAAILPLSSDLTVAVVGPLANAPHEQLGTWVFDGKDEDAITPLQAIEEYVPPASLHYAPGLTYSRDTSHKGFDAARAAAQQSDLVLLFLGEESIITGESHSRADIRLPGAQEALVQALTRTGKPVVAVVLAGRPLTMEAWQHEVDAIFYGFHPGTMTGPAIVDLLWGKVNPSAKLPMTFPKHVGQVPIYYNHVNTGKPPTPDSWVPMQEVPQKAVQTSVGNTSLYLDYGYEPAFPFGYGQSYTTFTFAGLTVSSTSWSGDQPLMVEAEVSNTGSRAGATVVQLYVRDHVGSRVQPVRRLVAFKKINLSAGERTAVRFQLTPADLAIFTRNGQMKAEPGDFTLFLGEDVTTDLSVDFTFKPKKP